MFVYHSVAAAARAPAGLPGPSRERPRARRCRRVGRRAEDAGRGGGGVCRLGV